MHALAEPKRGLTFTSPFKCGLLTAWLQRSAGSEEPPLHRPIEGMPQRMCEKCSSFLPVTSGHEGGVGVSPAARRMRAAETNAEFINEAPLAVKERELVGM